MLSYNNIFYRRPLIVPKNAKYCWLTVENSTVVFNTPNILVDVNDKMLVTFDDGILMASYNITIPKGLYDLDHLNAAIQQQLSNSGAAADAMTLIPDTATQKVVIKFRQFY